MASSTRKRTTGSDGDTKQNVVIETAKRQLHSAGAIAQEAATSGSWIYPIRGIIYLLSHPSLIRPMLPVLFKGVIMSLVVVFGLFALTYLPQVAILAFVSGPLAFIAAIPLVLGEAYIAVNFLARSFLFGQLGTDMFDAVLVQKGHVQLVQKGRQVTTSGGTAKQLGRVLTKPLSQLSVDSAVRYVLTLPLNFIPVVGTAFFLGWNGYKSGPSYHARYFELKGYDKDRRQAAIARRRGSYTSFGVAALLLNLIPVASILFTFTTAIGAALWASDIESGSSQGSPASQEVDVSLPKQEL